MSGRTPRGRRKPRQRHYAVALDDCSNDELAEAIRTLSALPNVLRAQLDPDFGVVVSFTGSPLPMFEQFATFKGYAGAGPIKVRGLTHDYEGREFRYD